MCQTEFEDDFDDNFSIVYKRHQEPDCKHKNSSHLLVSNLSPTVCEEDLIELFSDIGPVNHIAMLRNQRSAKIYFLKERDPDRAAKFFHNRQLDGCLMNCQIPIW